MELNIDSVTKKFKEKTAVDNFSVCLREGIYGLLGPNGSGKTTLMRILADVVKPTSGRVSLNGERMTILDEEYRNVIGYLPQDIGFYPGFTAEKFLYYVAALKGINKKEAEKKIDHLLKFVNLEDMRKKKIKGFSGGMKQRLGIAQALLNDPDILILDEPTAGLDPTERIRFKNLIAGISKDKIILLSTHIVSDIEFLANQIIVMKDGVLVKEDTPEALISGMRGKVWSMAVEEENLYKVGSEFKVVNTSRNEKGVFVRIVGDIKPSEDAVEEEPNLEDMFLYYFGKEEMQYGAVD